MNGVCRAQYAVRFSELYSFWDMRALSSAKNFCNVACHTSLPPVGTRSRGVHSAPGVRLHQHSSYTAILTRLLNPFPLPSSLCPHVAACHRPGHEQRHACLQVHMLTHGRPCSCACIANIALVVTR